MKMKMKKYYVTKEFMDELVAWRDEQEINVATGHSSSYVDRDDLEEMPTVVKRWWLSNGDPIERNNRLAAIILWLNGEDVFEAWNSHKFVVRNNTPDGKGPYYYVRKFDLATDLFFSLDEATKFDTREEALEWANSHQSVIEIDEDGKEV